jgi:dTDP-glucose pyrophosphorylase
MVDRGLGGGNVGICTAEKPSKMKEAELTGTNKKAIVTGEEHVPVVPATWETEVGELLEPRSSRSV